MEGLHSHGWLGFADLDAIESSHAPQTTRLQRQVASYHRRPSSSEVLA